MLCFVLAGALLGFLRWNFHPATIFIGTSGVMFIGYTLAVLSILGTAKVAVALLVLAVPIIDAFWIIVRRLVSAGRRSRPDRGHLHHRLLDLGLSHRQTVLLIYGICIVLGVLGLLLSGAAQLYAFLGVFFRERLHPVLAHGGFDPTNRWLDPFRFAVDRPDGRGPGDGASRHLRSLRGRPWVVRCGSLGARSVGPSTARCSDGRPPVADWPDSGASIGRGTARRRARDHRADRHRHPLRAAHDVEQDSPAADRG